MENLLPIYGILLAENWDNLKAKTFIYREAVGDSLLIIESNYNVNAVELSNYIAKTIDNSTLCS